MLQLQNNCIRNIFKVFQINRHNFLRSTNETTLNQVYQNFHKICVANKLKINKCNFCSKPVYDVNTNVVKDVVIFKYENPKFFKVINLFGLSQFFFWTYLSHFAFTTLRDAPVDETIAKEEVWYKRINLGENKFRNALTIFSFLIGYGVLTAAWLFTLRSVRFLVLKKGGKSISLVTYSPFGENRIMTVPLNCVSAETSRESAKVQLPLKIKNRKLFYILDMRGEFTNPRLFDYTVGLKRKLN
ncbi:transmembrane protein 223 [Condylostylus longicornis]|uniref:transmembrane protein 223 n=1 Tax=Condylostylus longicornis TaxID=2530218 RepID=UPI00244E1421|nr:transmembrane protein 223 [Condylostylus longicornis]